MKYIYSFVPFEHDYLSSTYKLDNNFINLAKASISRIKNSGKIIIYTKEELIPFFSKNINENIIYKKLDFNKSFFWAKSKLLALYEETKIDHEPLIHLDFDIFFVRDFLKEQVPEIFLSHGEPHNILGQEILNERKIVQSCILKWYDETFNFLKSKNFSEEILKLNINFSYNTSTFGGKNINLINNICKRILDFEEKYNNLYLKLIDDINTNKLNQNTLLFTAIMEQSLIAYLFEELKIIPNFMDIGYKTNYIHFVGDMKRNELFRQKLNYFCQNHINEESFDIKKYFHGNY
jgi:hypothetical protein